MSLRAILEIPLSPTEQAAFDAFMDRVEDSNSNEESPSAQAPVQESSRPLVQSRPFQAREITVRSGQPGGSMLHQGNIEMAVEGQRDRISVEYTVYSDFVFIHNYKRMRLQLPANYRNQLPLNPEFRQAFPLVFNLGITRHRVQQLRTRDRLDRIADAVKRCLTKIDALVACWRRCFGAQGRS